MDLGGGLAVLSSFSQFDSLITVFSFLSKLWLLIPSLGPSLPLILFLLLCPALLLSLCLSILSSSSSSHSFLLFLLLSFSFLFFHPCPPLPPFSLHFYSHPFLSLLSSLLLCPHCDLSSLPPSSFPLPTPSSSLSLPLCLFLLLLS